MGRVAITGASGLLGGNLAEAAIAAGHTVVATRRAGTQVKHLSDLTIDRTARTASPSGDASAETRPGLDRTASLSGDASAATRHGLEWVDADLGSVAALTKAFTGVEAVFHCAAAVTIKRDVTPEMTAANVTGTQHVIDACVAANVPRLVHTSSVVAVGLSTDGVPVDETAAWNFDAMGLSDAYAITKRQAEDVVNRAFDRLDCVIVNPTYMFGPRDARPSSGKLIVDVVRRRIPGNTPGYNNFVDVRDVARGMLAAWKRGRRGERYILAGHDMTYAEVFRRIAKVAGVAPPRLSIPRPIAALVGRYGDFVEARGKDPLVNSTQIRYAFTDRFRFRSDKAARELEYTISPLEPAIASAISWFRAHRML